jgi:hypothetical protein
MIINHKYKFIYLHIEKTGGTFIKESLRDIEGTELDVIHGHSAYRHIPDEYRDYFIFCTVRHPFDWYCSQWNQRRDFYWSSQYLFRADSFKEWLFNATHSKYSKQRFDDTINIRGTTGYEMEAYKEHNGIGWMTIKYNYLTEGNAKIFKLEEIETIKQHIPINLKAVKYNEAPPYELVVDDEMKGWIRGSDKIMMSLYE